MARETTRQIEGPMHCPGCGHGNRLDARFCGACGVARPVSCPACGHANAADLSCTA